MKGFTGGLLRAVYSFDLTRGGEDEDRARCLEWIFSHKPTNKLPKFPATGFVPRRLHGNRELRIGIDARYAPSTRVNVTAKFLPSPIRIRKFSVYCKCFEILAAQ